VVLLKEVPREDEGRGGKKTKNGGVIWHIF